MIGKTNNDNPELGIVFLILTAQHGQTLAIAGPCRQKIAAIEDD